MCRSWPEWVGSVEKEFYSDGQNCEPITDSDFVKDNICLIIEITSNRSALYVYYTKYRDIYIFHPKLL